jgi:hypothetical protein
MRRRSFAFEPLEGRTMLAGDVTVRSEGGNLFITGDDNANTVCIEGTGVAGRYVVESADTTRVTLNGVVQGPQFIVEGVPGKIVVDLNGGDDTFGINNVAVDQIIIDADEGDDLIGLGAYAALANLNPGGGGGGGALPAGPEVDRGTLIDNDVPQQTIGHFGLNVLSGGESNQGESTAQGRTLLFANEDFIFDYLSFVDVGSNGGAQRLGAGGGGFVIDQPATLVSPDVVESRGHFLGDSQQQINWIATTSIANGDTRIENAIKFTVATPNATSLGNLRFISYLDEDIESPGDDIMFLSGTPGQADFQVFTLDGPERVGFAQSGVYTPTPGLLENATWDGWAADEYSDLKSAIAGAGTTYSLAGNIDTTDLPQGTDPELGTIYGPGDITTAFAWTVNPQATSATISTFMEFIPRGDTGTIHEADGSVGVNDLLVINTNGGNDVVALARVFGDAEWDISLGDENNGSNNQNDDQAGNDIVPNIALNDQIFVFSGSGGFIDINAGSGDDLVNINYLTAHGNLVIDGVTGNDVISVNGSAFRQDVLLLGGSGLDTVAVDFSRLDGNGVLTIDSGADNDFILFARSLVRDGEVQIRSGGGQDRVVIGRYYADASGNLATGGNEVGTLRVDTGGDADVADIRGNLVFDQFFGIFGGGDDDVTVGFNDVRGSALLDGGSGSDDLFSAGNIFGRVDIVGFEGQQNRTLT